MGVAREQKMRRNEMKQPHNPSEPIDPSDLKNAENDLTAERARSRAEQKKVLKREGGSTGDLRGGTRLYEQAKAAQQQRKRKTLEAAKRRQEQEMQGVTFKPTINGQRAESSNQRKSQVLRPEDRLLLQGEKMHGRKEQLKASALAQHEDICTFHPTINTK